MCPASHMPFEDESVDLMTCSQAWHYLDPDTVFPEIDRVLKRPGVLAVYAYGRPMLHKQQLDDLFSHTWENVVIYQGPYGNIRTPLDNHYRDVKLPYPLAERHDMQLESTMSLEELEGFVNSWGSYERYCKQYPGNTIVEDMMMEMKKLLLEGEEAADGTTQLSHMTFGLDTAVFLLLAVKN